MDFKGLSSEIMYYKDLQEKSGKDGSHSSRKIQSAVEPFLENKMSDANENR
jgi:protease-4